MRHGIVRQKRHRVWWGLLQMSHLLVRQMRHFSFHVRQMRHLLVRQMRHLFVRQVRLEVGRD